MVVHKQRRPRLILLLATALLLQGILTSTPALADKSPSSPSYSYSAASHPSSSANNHVHNESNIDDDNVDQLLQLKSKKAGHQIAGVDLDAAAETIEKAVGPEVMAAAKKKANKFLEEHKSKNKKGNSKNTKKGPATKDKKSGDEDEQQNEGDTAVEVNSVNSNDNGAEKESDIPINVEQVQDYLSDMWGDIQDLGKDPAVQDQLRGWQNNEDVQAQIEHIKNLGDDSEIHAKIEELQEDPNIRAGIEAVKKGIRKATQKEKRYHYRGQQQHAFSEGDDRQAASKKYLEVQQKQRHSFSQQKHQQHQEGNAVKDDGFETDNNSDIDSDAEVEAQAVNKKNKKHKNHHNGAHEESLVIDGGRHNTGNNHVAKKNRKQHINKIKPPKRHGAVRQGGHRHGKKGGAGKKIVGERGRGKGKKHHRVAKKHAVRRKGNKGTVIRDDHPAVDTKKIGTPISPPVKNSGRRHRHHHHHRKHHGGGHEGRPGKSNGSGPGAILPGHETKDPNPPVRTVPTPSPVETPIEVPLKDTAPNEPPVPQSPSVGVDAPPITSPAATPTLAPEVPQETIVGVDAPPITSPAATSTLSSEAPQETITGENRTPVISPASGPSPYVPTPPKPVTRDPVVENPKNGHTVPSEEVSGIPLSSPPTIAKKPAMPVVSQDPAESVSPAVQTPRQQQPEAPEETEEEQHSKPEEVIRSPTESPLANNPKVGEEDQHQDQTSTEDKDPQRLPEVVTPLEVPGHEQEQPAPSDPNNNNDVEHQPVDRPRPRPIDRRPHRHPGNGDGNNSNNSNNNNNAQTPIAVTPAPVTEIEHFNDEPRVEAPAAAVDSPPKTDVEDKNKEDDNIFTINPPATNEADQIAAKKPELPIDIPLSPIPQPLSPALPTSDDAPKPSDPITVPEQVPAPISAPEQVPAPVSAPEQDSVTAPAPEHAKDPAHEPASAPVISDTDSIQDPIAAAPSESPLAPLSPVAIPEDLAPPSATPLTSSDNTKAANPILKDIGGDDDDGDDEEDEDEDEGEDSLLVPKVGQRVTLDDEGNLVFSPTAPETGTITPVSNGIDNDDGNDDEDGGGAEEAVELDTDATAAADKDDEDEDDNDWDEDENNEPGVIVEAKKDGLRKRQIPAILGIFGVKGADNNKAGVFKNDQHQQQQQEQNPKTEKEKKVEVLKEAKKAQEPAIKVKDEMANAVVEHKDEKKEAKKANKADAIEAVEDKIQNKKDRQIKDDPRQQQQHQEKENRQDVVEVQADQKEEKEGKKRKQQKVDIDENEQDDDFVQEEKADIKNEDDNTNPGPIDTDEAVSTSIDDVGAEVEFGDDGGGKKKKKKNKKNKKEHKKKTHLEDDENLDQGQNNIPADAADANQGDENEAVDGGVEGIVVDPFAVEATKIKKGHKKHKNHHHDQQGEQQAADYAFQADAAVDPFGRETNNNGDRVHNRGGIHKKGAHDDDDQEADDKTNKPSSDKNDKSTTIPAKDTKATDPKAAIPGAPPVPQTGGGGQIDRKAPGSEAGPKGSLVSPPAKEGKGAAVGSGYGTVPMFGPAQLDLGNGASSLTRGGSNSSWSRILGATCVAVLATVFMYL
ncbi:hypothetical protein EC991_000443 [Linnemannia zychae]|nr:hypothetical protein EC991_000443 [Linnemannia zychae]